MKPLLPLLLLLVLAPAAWAQSQPWSGASVIKDPEWRKSFLGSYGFLSGAEPQVNTTELESLREVIDLLQVNPSAAATVLKARVGPDSSAALDFILANLEFQNGELESAKANYSKAIEKFPDFRRAHKNLGLLLIQNQSFEEAVEHLSRAVELGDRDGRNYGLLGYAHLTNGNVLAAEVAYRNAILQQPETRDWKLGLARSLLEMEKFEEAAALFDALIEENPEDATLWLLQANAYVGLDQPLRAAVNLESVRLMEKAQSSSLVLLGDIYMNAGMPDFAASAYLDVIEGDREGRQFSVAYRAAQLLVRTGSHDRAQEVLDAIRKRYWEGLSQAEQLRVLTQEAKVARAQGRDKEAAELLESIVERDGTRGEALLELADYYKGQGRVERARLLIERAENLEATEYAALLAHAQLEVSERKYDEAATLLRRALQIRREPRVERFLERVEQAI